MSALDTQLFLQERLKTCGWQIAKTVAMGIAAAGLAMFGQECLLRARPLFSLIDQNFSLWQTGYVLVLMVMGLLWAAALLQKINLLQDCQRHISMHRQRELQKAAREAKAMAARQEKQKQVTKEASPRVKPTRSTKFDY